MRQFFVPARVVIKKVITRTIKVSPAPIRRYLQRYYQKISFKRALQNFKVKLVFQCKSESSDQVFCIVHWNAPDFLLLNLKQLEALHPESKIYILDNGSQKSNLYAVKKGLEQFDNITLFSAKPVSRKGGMNHTVALQFLLNYSAEQSDEIAVFLDQDCLLSKSIEGLAAKLNNDCLLVGARDYVVIPKECGRLKPGKLRIYPNRVHPSFMILQPKRIRQLFGDYSFFHPKVVSDRHYELYHGLSYRLQGRILFLETKVHEEIPLLTSYLHQGIIYAWHAWYSSRTVGLSDQDFVDSHPVFWLRETRRLAYSFMEQIHENTLIQRRN